MAIECFKNQNLPHETVFANGETVLLSIYKLPENITTLQAARSWTFNHLSRNRTAIKLECLPPTAEAARQHFYRVYLQVQNWLGNELSPEEWGWKRAGEMLLPVQTTQDPAPPELLKMIFCQCKTGCEKNCSCLKAGLKCSSICGSCQLTQCSNYKRNEGIFPEELEVEVETEVEEETEGLEGQEAEIQLEEEREGMTGGGLEMEQEGVGDENNVDDQEYLSDSDDMEWFNRV